MPQAKDSASGTNLVTGIVLPTPPENVTFTNEHLKVTLKRLGKDSPTEGTNIQFEPSSTLFL